MELGPANKDVVTGPRPSLAFLTLALARLGSAVGAQTGAWRAFSVQFPSWSIPIINRITEPPPAKAIFSRQKQYPCAGTHA